MTLRHIKIFLAVCESQNNVTRAAEKLLMAQPAVSLALSELEAYYEVKLFDLSLIHIYPARQLHTDQEYIPPPCNPLALPRHR